MCQQIYFSDGDEISLLRDLRELVSPLKVYGDVIDDDDDRDGNCCLCNVGLGETLAMAGVKCEYDFALVGYELPMTRAELRAKFERRARLDKQSEEAEDADQGEIE